MPKERNGTEKENSRSVNAVRRFLMGLLNVERGGKSGRRLGFTVPEALEIPVARRRAEFARELLNSSAFVDSIQMMNEEVVAEIASTDPLDTDKLTVLRLRLGVISDFQSRLSLFIDEYQTIEMIKRQSRETQRDFLRHDSEVA